jgi:hypothetical protein
LNLKFSETAGIILELHVLDQHDGGHDVLQKDSVVGHEQEGALVGTEFVFEPEDARKIEMVGGL